MNIEQKEALKEAEKEQKPFTIEEKIEQYKAQIQKANNIIEQWSKVGLRCEGAIEVLEQMLKE
jgi:hypothetical protein